jgi:hypothetical protein
MWYNRKILLLELLGSISAFLATSLTILCCIVKLLLFLEMRQGLGQDAVIFVKP